MKKIIIVSILGLLFTTSLGTAFQISSSEMMVRTDKMETTNAGYIDITPAEAWEMMSTSEDGIQIPFDVRRFDEYVNERIVLPDENDFIRWFPYELTSDGPGPIKNEGVLLQFFMNYYKDNEIIIYCRTGRRTAEAAQILIENGFSGTVYNMLGGITEWKAVGLPTTQ